MLDECHQINAAVADSHFLQQTSCRDDLTTKADVYAFGVILWELFVDVNERAELAMLASTQCVHHLFCPLSAVAACDAYF